MYKKKGKTVSNIMPEHQIITCSSSNKCPKSASPILNCMKNSSVFNRCIYYASIFSSINIVQ